MKKSILVIAAIVLLYTNIFAQLIAAENFNYPVSGVITGNNGGIGWGEAWKGFAAGAANNTGIAAGGLSFPPQVAGLGNQNHQPGLDVRNFRMLDTSNAAFFPYMDNVGDPTDPATGQNFKWGKAFGKDNTTIWFSMLMKGNVVPNVVYGYGGMHLMYGYDLSIDKYGGKLKHQRFQFGTDNNTSGFYMLSRTTNSNPSIPLCGTTQRTTITANTTVHLLVCRIDFKPGPETVYLWIDPPAGCTPPSTLTANATMTSCDFRFNAVNVGAGSASGSVNYDLDEFYMGLNYTDVISCGLLPLHFINCNGSANRNSATIFWEVDGEENIDHYEIEKATDGLHYTNAGTIISLHNSNSIVYTFTDDQFYTTAQYRIKAVENSGKVFYSGICKVRHGANSGIMIYPNPASNRLYCRQPSKRMDISIIDLAGKTMFTGSYTQSLFSMDISKLMKGTYIVKMMNEDGMHYRKLIKN